ncbi:MAG: hypothetical protein M3Y85_04310 [Bacteroidota bacterium]|nr:hypothetical protein [Bacteroidota bacterium]
MTNKIKWLSIFSLMVLCIGLPSIVLAQVDCTDPFAQNCPIDGGLSLLIAAGIGYGVKKVRDSRKQKPEEQNL